LAYPIAGKIRGGLKQVGLRGVQDVLELGLSKYAKKGLLHRLLRIISREKQPPEVAMESLALFGEQGAGKFAFGGGQDTGRPGRT
jgi:hypothetical protein